MSYKKQLIQVEDLLVNPNNFRFDPVTSQKEAINTMINKMKSKLKKQAEDIAQNGLNPTESLSVTKAYRGRKYIVHEGNRRLTAIKLIDNPRIILLDEKTKAFFQKLKTDYGHKLPSKIECTIFDQEKDTYHWTRLKHTGENKGVGVVPWNNRQQGRFEAYITDSKPKKHIQVQNFMQKHAILFPDHHSTTLQRLISTPYVREKIGIDFEDGDLKCSNTQTAIDSLKRISSAMKKSDFNVRKLELVKDRKKWINTVLKPEPKQQPIIRKRAGQGEKKISVIDRTTLIPKDFIINIEQSKVQAIYEELKELKVDKYSNAIAVLFRVFLELSIIHFIEKKKKEGTDLLKDLKEKLKKKGKNSNENNITLRQKMKASYNYMIEKKILTKNELRYTRIAIDNQYDISSIQTFNSYVHNLSHIPLERDLKKSWNNMQKFIEKLWE